jgi:hypothetical protein
MFGFHGGQFGLALHIEFMSGSSIRIDGLFGEVVGASSGYSMQSVRSASNSREQYHAY